MGFNDSGTADIFALAEEQAGPSGRQAVPTDEQRRAARRPPSALTSLGELGEGEFGQIDVRTDFMRQLESAIGPLLFSFLGNPGAATQELLGQTGANLNVPGLVSPQIRQDGGLSGFLFGGPSQSGQTGGTGGTGGIEDLLGALKTAVPPPIEQKQRGGPLDPNAFSIVGEQGPELIPPGNAEVIPLTPGATGAGNVTGGITQLLGALPSGGTPNDLSGLLGGITAQPPVGNQISQLLGALPAGAPSDLSGLLGGIGGITGGNAPQTSDIGIAPLLASATAAVSGGKAGALPGTTAPSAQVSAGQAVDPAAPNLLPSQVPVPQPVAAGAIDAFIPSAPGVIDPTGGGAARFARQAELRQASTGQVPTAEELIQSLTGQLASGFDPATNPAFQEFLATGALQQQAQRVPGAIPGEPPSIDGQLASGELTVGTAAPGAQPDAMGNLGGPGGLVGQQAPPAALLGPAGGVPQASVAGPGTQQQDLPPELQLPPVPGQEGGFPQGQANPAAGVGAIQNFLQQQAPEAQTFQQAQDLLFGPNGILSQGGGGGQAIIDALGPLFERNLQSGIAQLQNAAPSVFGSGFGQAGGDLAQRALQDFNLMSAQALQQGQQTQLGGLGILGQLAGQAGQNPFSRLLGAGQLQTQRDLGFQGLGQQQAQFESQFGLSQQQQQFNQAVQPTLAMLQQIFGFIGGPTGFQTVQGPAG